MIKSLSENINSIIHMNSHGDFHKYALFIILYKRLFIYEKDGITTSTYSIVH